MFPVAIRTVGCKLNQIESEALADSFRKAGFSIVPKDADIDGPGIVVVNTCTVTSKADQKTRALIRKTLRQNPGSCVIVTGCYAKLDPGELEALEGGPSTESPVRRLFVPPGGGEGAGAEKSALLGLPDLILEAARNGSGLFEAVELWMARHGSGGGSRAEKDPFGFSPGELSFHSRGYLKIQDGCDNACAYCRARLARGPSVSVAPEAALAALRAFEEKGVAELAIAGVNIAQYRHSGLDLAGLLACLLEGSKTVALRVSSLEPDGIGEKLVSALAHPRIRPHFHLSVQSGSGRVLQRMGRAYDPRAVEEAAARLRSVKDDPFLACDMISGFPGESADDFAQTLALCEKIGFAWIHSFPFSPRPGTPAFSFDGRVNEREIGRRAQALVKLAVQGRQSYVRRWLGREVSAVAEKAPDRAGQCRAVSENYLKLLVNCAGRSPPPGSSLRCVPVSPCPGSDGEKPDAIADIAG